MGQRIAVRKNRTHLGYSGQLGQSERKKIETSIPPMSAWLLLPPWVQLRCHPLKKSSLTTHTHVPHHSLSHFIKRLAFVSCVVTYLWFHCLLSVAHLEGKCSEGSILAHFCLKSPVRAKKLAHTGSEGTAVEQAGSKISKRLWSQMWEMAESGHKPRVVLLRDSSAMRAADRGQPQRREEPLKTSKR